MTDVRRSTESRILMSRRRGAATRAVDQPAAVPRHRRRRAAAAALAACGSDDDDGRQRQRHVRHDSGTPAPDAAPATTAPATGDTRRPTRSTCSRGPSTTTPTCSRAGATSRSRSTTPTRRRCRSSSRAAVRRGYDIVVPTGVYIPQLVGAGLLEPARQEPDPQLRQPRRAVQRTSRGTRATSTACARTGARPGGSTTRRS